MNRKRLTIILAVLTALLLLTGCFSGAVAEGGGTDGTQEAAEEKAKEITTTLPSEAAIGVVYAEDGDSFAGRFTERIKGYLVTAGIREESIAIRETDAQGLLDEAKKQLDSRCSVLIVGNAGESDAPRITDEAAKAGIPVLYFGSDPGEKERARWEKEGIRASYVGSDSSKAAGLRAELLDKMDFAKIDHNKDEQIGAIVLYEGDGSAADLINEQTMAAFEEHGLDVHDLDADSGEEAEEDGEDSEEVGNTEEADSPEASSEATQDDYDYVIGKMQDYGKELEMIVCANDTQAVEAWRAVSEEKRLVGHDVLILGLGDGEEILGEVARGNIADTFFNDSMAQATCASDYTIYYLKGIEVPYTTVFDCVHVTVDNAQEILDILSTQSSSGDTREESEEVQE